MSDTQSDIHDNDPLPSTRRQSRDLNELFAALAKAQGDIEGAKKDSDNPHFKSKYADLASVWAAVRAPLAKNGLAVMQWPRTVGNGVEVETILAHASGQYMSDVFWVPCSKMDAHGLGSATTYARRFSLASILGVAPEDDDGNSASIGAPGSAGAGADFRPAGPRKFQGGGNMAAEAERDGLTDSNRAKGTLSSKPATPKVQTKAEKIIAAVDKRVEALRSKSSWLRTELDDFWRDDKKWIDWMSDPNNDALAEYERFTTAFADAEMKIVPVELA